MTEKRRKSAYVTLKAHLFEVGIPIVSLYARKVSGGDQNFVLSAIPDEFGEVDYYLAVYVDRKTLRKYFSEQCDLRYLYEYATVRKFYTTPSLAEVRNGKIKLTEYLDVIEEDMLPEPRFFASSHTSNFGEESVLGSEQRLLIDGSWDMQEFGGFYQKFADLYSFEQATNYFIDKASVRADKVRAAFAAKPFKGGSSYMGLFSDLFDLIPSRERPALEGIEYHSPGHVDLRGREEILAHVQNQIVVFLDNITEIQKAHDNLRNFMSSNNLLKITAKNVNLDSSSMKTLAALTASFYNVMPIGNKGVLLELAQNNPTVHAKIGLGVFRRLKATAYFFAQGRLSY